MTATYFDQLHQATPTRVWVNNPTIAEAERAIANGIRSSTTNPTFAAKILPTLAADDRQAVLNDAIRSAGDADARTDAVQQILVARLLRVFAPHQDPANPLHGLVSIQGNPHHDTDCDHLLHEAAHYDRLGPNVIAKIPATRAGLLAIEDLLTRGKPVLATEMMSVAQTRAACEVYQRVVTKTGRRPVFIITHITGIYDECLAKQAAVTAPDLAAEVLDEAGFLVRPAIASPPPSPSSTSPS